MHSLAIRFIDYLKQGKVADLLTDLEKYAACPQDVEEADIVHLAGLAKGYLLTYGETVTLVERVYLHAAYRILTEWVKERFPRQFKAMVRDYTAAMESVFPGLATADPDFLILSSLTVRLRQVETELDRANAHTVELYGRIWTDIGSQCDSVRSRPDIHPKIGFIAEGLYLQLSATVTRIVDRLKKSQSVAANPWLHGQAKLQAIPEKARAPLTEALDAIRDRTIIDELLIARLDEIINPTAAIALLRAVWHDIQLMTLPPATLSLTEKGDVIRSACTNLRKLNGYFGRDLPQYDFELLAERFSRDRWTRACTYWIAESAGSGTLEDYQSAMVVLDQLESLRVNDVSWLDPQIVDKLRTEARELKVQSACRRAESKLRDPKAWLHPDSDGWPDLDREIQTLAIEDLSCRAFRFAWDLIQAARGTRWSDDNRPFRTSHESGNQPLSASRMISHLVALKTTPTEPHEHIDFLRDLLPLINAQKQIVSLEELENQVRRAGELAKRQNPILGPLVEHLTSNLPEQLLLRWLAQGSFESWNNIIDRVADHDRRDVLDRLHRIAVGLLAQPGAEYSAEDQLSDFRELRDKVERYPGIVLAPMYYDGLAACLRRLLDLRTAEWETCARAGSVEEIESSDSRLSAKINWPSLEHIGGPFIELHEEYDRLQRQFKRLRDDFSQRYKLWHFVARIYHDLGQKRRKPAAVLSEILTEFSSPLPTEAVELLEFTATRVEPRDLPPEAAGAIVGFENTFLVQTPALVSVVAHYACLGLQKELLNKLSDFDAILTPADRAAVIWCRAIARRDFGTLRKLCEIGADDTRKVARDFFESGNESHDVLLAGWLIARVKLLAGDPKPRSVETAEQRCEIEKKTIRRTLAQLYQVADAYTGLLPDEQTIDHIVDTVELHCKQLAESAHAWEYTLREDDPTQLKRQIGEALGARDQLRPIWNKMRWFISNGDIHSWQGEILGALAGLPRLDIVNDTLMIAKCLEIQTADAVRCLSALSSWVMGVGSDDKVPKLISGLSPEELSKDLRRLLMHNAQIIKSHEVRDLDEFLNVVRKTHDTVERWKKLDKEFDENKAHILGCLENPQRKAPDCFDRIRDWIVKEIYASAVPSERTDRLVLFADQWKTRYDPDGEWYRRLSAPRPRTQAAGFDQR